MPMPISLKSLCGGAALAVLGGLSSAKADIVFCNQFARTVLVAIAYPQEDAGWLSRGWLELDPGQCRPFDTAVRVKTFYYWARTDPYRNAAHQRGVNVWGEGRVFAVWDRDNFEYWNAEERVLKSTLEPFSQGPETEGDAVSATVTFDADGQGSSITLN
jgi:uncharacterized membrane protein